LEFRKNRSLKDASVSGEAGGREILCQKVRYARTKEICTDLDCKGSRKEPREASKIDFITKYGNCS
jgi:hypothetical protein